VKKGWQAFDCLDEDWCPIVQLHGIFTDISTDELPGPYPGAARARPGGMHAQRSRKAPTTNWGTQRR
jgi:hypothetical protein